MKHGGFTPPPCLTTSCLKFYHQQKPGQTLKDIYPAFIKRLERLQNSLRKPVIESCNLSDKTIQDTVATFIIHFSEPMTSLSALDLILAVENQGKVKREQRMLTSETNGLAWSKDGKTVKFRLELAKDAPNYVVFNYSS